MEDINTNQNTEQQPEPTPTPEASGDPSGARTFTQEEVNRIVSERLARERARAEPSLEEAREADLRAREARLSCREFIAAEGYPAELLELFDTGDAEAFKAAVEKLDGIVGLPSKHRKPAPRFTTPRGGWHGAPVDRSAAMLEAAFKPPKI